MARKLKYPQDFLHRSEISSDYCFNSEEKIISAR
jgi:hypothetical protein